MIFFEGIKLSELEQGGAIQSWSQTMVSRWALAGINMGSWVQGQRKMVGSVRDGNYDVVL